MIGWRRRAKAQRETVVSQERLYELVNQTLMENFGPLGSFAITRRSASDTDDIFHTALARSVAHDIVANLAEHGITVKSVTAVAEPAPVAAPALFTPRARIAQPARPALAPVERVAVDRRLAGAIASVAAVAAPVSTPVVAAPAAVAAGAGFAQVEEPSPLTAVIASSAPDALEPDPRDDDALRALVAHHAEVEAAVAARTADAAARIHG